MENIRLIVGLGNPGRKYENTRHNAGFWWVDAIAGRARASWSKQARSSAHATRVDVDGREFWLLKPDTYMNESGRAVASFTHFHKIEPGEMLVVHDELDLPPGTVKLKKGGGTGGHNGLTDIVEALDTKDFWRLRIGIGHPGHKDRVTPWVLGRPGKDDEASMLRAIDDAIGVLPLAVSGDMNEAMKRLHTPKDS
jgi:PTH1 family peptidyl-tRNA hydrolase